MNYKELELIRLYLNWLLDTFATYEYNNDIETKDLDYKTIKYNLTCYKHDMGEELGNNIEEEKAINDMLKLIKEIEAYYD